jgi:hypothetical protein
MNHAQGNRKIRRETKGTGGLFFHKTARPICHSLGEKNGKTRNRGIEPGAVSSGKEEKVSWPEGLEL